MDVKSAFLYEKIEEEVYVCKPPGFEDPDFPDRVYKVEKALYGLHQAPRAWCETLSTYLLDNGFQRGKIDKTLFIKRHKGDILLVQVYVDDIIFGLTKTELCNAFERLMHEKFQMKVKTASTPIETQKPLIKDENGENVDVHMYRSMISSLMYLTSSRPNIIYQVNPKVSHLHIVKRIFRYLKGQPKLGLWYPKDSPFDLVAYTDSDYAGASLDRKSTTGGCQCQTILQAANPVKEILLKLNLFDHRSILTDLKVTPTKHGRMTKPYSSPCFIANCFNARYLKIEVKVPGSSCLTDSWPRAHTQPTNIKTS
ncbi:putative ribonuclease H-like domain-containing protein [Tanacetum coccineum]|uniref:Ribonuclease H-like domain-containing protein n=1 Tax=Tanacetum coccineum TaxID=301880 RepID=A0ABQ5DIV5_9ASTR